MTAGINKKEAIETTKRDLEENLFESDRVIIEFQEVRRDDRGNFVPIEKEGIIGVLTKTQYFSVGRSRGDYYEKLYPRGPTTEEGIPTKEGKKVSLDYVYIRMGNKRTPEVPLFPLLRLNMMGRWDVPDEEIHDGMSRYQLEISLIEKEVVSGKKNVCSSN